MGTMRLKNKTKYRKQKRIIIIIIVMVTTVFIVNKMINNISTFFIAYAKDEARKAVTTSINAAVTDEILEKFKNNELYRITKNNENEIQLIDFNSYVVNDILKEVTLNIEQNLLKIEDEDFSTIKAENSKIEDKIAFYIPFGAITNSPLLNNKGPLIPVRLKLIGSVLTNIETRVKEYGINNSLIEIVIYIEAKEQVLLPIISDSITITNEIPVAYNIVNGKVPSYYSGNSLNKSSEIYSLPIK